MRDNKTPASQKTALAHSIICVFASAAFFIILWKEYLYYALFVVCLFTRF